MPADGSSRTTSATSSTRASPSSPVPAPTSTSRSVGTSGIAVRTASATSAARAIRSGVSQSLARSSKLATAPPSEGPGEEDVRGPVRLAGKPDDVAGELPDPRLLLARERLHLLLDQVDPAAGDRVHVVVGEASDRVDPGRVDELHDAVAGVAGPVQLASGIQEARRLVGGGDRPDRLREQVQPGRVETATERQVGVEPARVLEAGPVIDGDRE